MTSSEQPESELLSKIKPVVEESTDDAGVKYKDRYATLIVVVDFANEPAADIYLSYPADKDLRYLAAATDGARKLLKDTLAELILQGYNGPVIAPKKV